MKELSLRDLYNPFPTLSLHFHTTTSDNCSCAHSAPAVNLELENFCLSYIHRVFFNSIPLSALYLGVKGDVHFLLLSAWTRDVTFLLFVSFLYFEGHFF